MIKLVGHRGLPQHYPENSIAGVVAAYEAGAAAVEIDIQFSKDGVPMLFHDAQLERVTGLSGALGAFEADILGRMSAHESSRFEERFLGTPIERLAALVPIIQARPEVELFVEIKEDSFDYIDRDSVVASLSGVLDAIKDQVTIISYDLPVLRKVRDALGWPVGWVLRHYCEQSGHWATDFQPDYLICNAKKIPEVGALWHGLWEWFIYDITDPKDAERLALRGVRWVESWDVAALAEQLCEMG